MNQDDLDIPVDEALLRGDDIAGEEALEAEEPVAEAESKAEELAAAKEAEELATAAEVSDKEHKENSSGVTQERFNQVWGKNKELQDQINELLSQQKPAQQAVVDEAVDIKSLRLLAKEAFIDGEDDKYNELMDKIDAEVYRKAEEAAESRYAQREQSTSLQDKANELVALHPILDSNTGDPEAIQMVIDLRDAAIARGVNPVKALVDAANRIAPLYSKAKEPEGKADSRITNAVARGVKDSAGVPLVGAGVGNRAQELADKENLSQPQWDKLTPAERDARLAE